MKYFSTQDFDSVDLLYVCIVFFSVTDLNAGGSILLLLTVIYKVFWKKFCQEKCTVLYSSFFFLYQLCDKK